VSGTTVTGATGNFTALNSAGSTLKGTTTITGLNGLQEFKDNSDSDTTEVRFYQGNSANYVGFRAPVTLDGSNTTFRLPSGDGSSGNLLTTDGAGRLTWSVASAEQVYSTGINSTALPGEGTVYVVLKANSTGSGLAYSTGSLYYTAASNYLNAVGLSGTTITGNTSNFGTGNFVLAKSTTVSGTTVTGTYAQFTNITGGTVVGTTTVSGTTVTGGSGNFNNATIGTNLTSNGGSTLKKTTTITGLFGLLQFKDNADGDSTEVRFYQGNSANYVAFRAPTTLDGSNTTFRLPSGDSTSGDVLTTDGAGKLSFTTISAGGSSLSGITETGRTQYGANQNTVSETGTVIIGTAAGKISNFFGRTVISSGVLIGQNVCSGTTGFASNEGKNVIIGCEAATELYEPERTVIIGFEGGKGGANTYRTSDDCVLIGYQAGKDANIFGYTTSTDKAIVIGSKACNLHAGIANGIYIGSEACSGFITSHTNNTVIGWRGLRKAGTAAYNVFIGSNVAESGEYYTNTVAIGYQAAAYNASGTSENSGNVWIGYQCGKYLLNENQNSVVIGEKAATTGYGVKDSVIIGKDAIGFANNVSGIIVIGYKAGGKPNNSGKQNIFIGNQTASGHQTGEFNTYVGHGIASGMFVGNNHKNTILGYGAVPFLNTATGNVIIGYQACLTSRPTTGCVYIGADIAPLSYTGIGNTVVGHLAAAVLDDGAHNTILGKEAGGVATGNNNTVIGYQAAASTTSVSNQITLGNSSITSLRCNVTSISSLSDERDKTNITDLEHGVNFIKRLRPVKFDWARRDGSFEGKKDYGFIAQELQTIETELNTIEYTNLVDDSNPEKLEAAPFKTYPILVQAVKELINRLEIAEQAIVQLQGT